MEVSYAGIETGGHSFVIEATATGEYVAYRID